MKSAEEKAVLEQKVLETMNGLYCRNNHRDKSLCPDCANLLEYASQRSERCPYGENKTFCKNCKTHCYKPDMRERIKTVMRYSGPRMLFRHPVLFAQHLREEAREKST